MTSDLDLLRQFARENSQNAFAALVQRHLNLVYSAALRQVRSPQLAEEIAQSVFADLARSAGKIRSAGVSPANSLSPWLYAVTRRTAIDVIRKESRRRLREQIAVEMNNMNATATEWTQIAPLLDDAMAALDETDRTAILLRYFENKSLREVGEALGASEDAAQKRVSRAVERLREFFSKRKVTIGAGGLAILISANAVQSAPVGLAAAVSAAAVLTGTTVSTSTAITATKVIAMTTLQKTIIGTALVAAVGTGVFEAHQASQLREQNQALRQQQTPLGERIRRLQRERDDARNQLAGLESENAQLQSNQKETELLKLRGEVARLQTAKARQTNNSTGFAAEALVAKVTQLKQWLAENPNENIPELRLLTDQEWLRCAASFPPLKSNGDFRRAFSYLRETAKNDLAWDLGRALDDYIAAKNGELPDSIFELKPYFSSAIHVDNEMLHRYQLLHTGRLSNFSRDEPLIAERKPVDLKYDMLFKIGAFGYSYRDVGGTLGGGGSHKFGKDITSKVESFVRH